MRQIGPVMISSATRLNGRIVPAGTTYGPSTSLANALTHTINYTCRTLARFCSHLRRCALSVEAKPPLPEEGLHTYSGWLGVCIEKYVPHPIKETQIVLQLSLLCRALQARTTRRKVLHVGIISISCLAVGSVRYLKWLAPTWCRSIEVSDIQLYRMYLRYGMASSTCAVLLAHACAVVQSTPCACVVSN
jgi:hypothetical protein